MISCRGLHGLAGDLDRYENPLLLEPFRSKAIFMIGPLSVGQKTSWCGLQRDGPKSKFVEREDSSPFRRVPKRGDGVR